MLSDTHPDAERMQIELLRRATPDQRFCTTIDLTAALIGASRQTIAERNPTLSRRDLDLRCVALYYGNALAARLRDYQQTMPEQHDAAQ